MLQKMRQQSRSTLIMLLFGFIIFVFVFSFGAGSDGFRAGGCGRAGEAVRVNDESIDEMSFKYHYDMILRAQMNRFPSNRNFKPQDRAFLREQTMHQLVDNALLRQAANRIGLHVTEEERNRDIRETPIFQDANNRFSFQLYKAVVERNFGTTLPLFEQLWLDRMLANRMREIIQDTARVTDDELKHAFVNKNNKVELSFAKCHPEGFKKEIKVTQQEIGEFLNNQAARIETTYHAQSDRFSQPKQVKVTHVLFEVGKNYDTEQVADKKEQAQFTLEDLKKGADFAEQASRYSEDYETRDQGGALPFMTLESLAAKWGTPFAEKAFALSKGELSDIIKSEKGFHVMKVMDIIEAEHRSLEEVKSTLAEEILLGERSQDLARKEAHRLFEALKSGKKLEDLLPKSKDKESSETSPQIKSVESGSTGLFAKMSGYLPNIGSNEEMANVAFSLTEEQPYPEKVFEIQSSSGDSPTFVVFVLTKRMDADMSVFSDAKDNLKEQILRTRRLMQLQAWLQRVREESHIDVNPAFMSELVQPGFRTPSGSQ